jgi:hypothetical protein
MVFAVRAAVSAAGEVEVSLPPEGPDGTAPPPDLAGKIRLIVRTAVRQAKAEGEAPAFRIVRWRADQ